MRKLASLQRIQEIKPIPQADKIAAYRVGGWWVVDQINAYHVGDLVIYCEIDSWIPNHLAPFLSKGQQPRIYEGVLGERLKTVRLRGQLSQGLLLNPQTVLTQPLPEHTDVTELLGIVKWEAPIPAQLAGEVRGAYPSHTPRTDQERIQNLTDQMPNWAGLIWEISEKLDGSSMTVYVNGSDSGVCSRNLNLRETASNTLWQVARGAGLIDKLTQCGRNIALQGELIGEGIQKNPYGLRGQHFRLFDIWDIDQQAHWSAEQRRAFCAQWGIDTVPILSTGALPATVDEILAMANGISQLNNKVDREGIVCKCISDTSLHFKAISNNWLLKTGN